MTAVIAVSVALHADPRNVSQARRMLRGALARSGAHDLVDSAVLVLSEVITNSFVHAGTAVRVHLWSTPAAVRVEVEDGTPRAPTHHRYADTAGTGRGLQLLDALTDRWGTVVRASGKTVWFEVGPFDVEVGSTSAADATGDGAAATSDTSLIDVTLRQVPLLMHVAWQEHAASLLREYLLHVLDDDPDILERHAHASQALSLLKDQLPAPQLSEQPDALMSDAVEPKVSADELLLTLPTASLDQFEVLNDLLGAAIAAARSGRFLSPDPPMSSCRWGGRC